MTDTLKEGTQAPEFSAPRDGGETVTLADYAGRIVVLYFYPRDDTPGCTLEALDFTALAADFAKAGAVVIGVSKDTVGKHEKFRDKHGLGVVLVSDSETRIAESYGAWKEKQMYGKKFMGIERTTVIIDGNGIIRRVFNKVKPKEHAKDVLDAVQALSR